MDKLREDQSAAKENIGLIKRKELMLRTLAKSFGNITASCQESGISRQTFYNWLNDDPEFKRIYEATDYEEMKIDFVESKLMSNINKGKEASTIFFLKTKGRKRGYQEHLDVSQKGYLQNLISQPMDEAQMKAFIQAFNEAI
jgi:hypothetical protein